MSPSRQSSIAIRRRVAARPGQGQEKIVADHEALQPSFIDKYIQKSLNAGQISAETRRRGVETHFVEEVPPCVEL
jgi:hypothetical protein